MNPRHPGFLLVIAGLLFGAGAGTAWAQIYRWNDPDTGRARLSNRPPAWYQDSAEVKGPRVVVTTEGRLLDDTQLSLDERAKLRNDHLTRLRLREEAALAEKRKAAAKAVPESEGDEEGNRDPRR